MSILQVFLCALATAVATGFGALPFIFVKSLSRRWLGASNAVAAGLMLAASFGLIYEGVNYGLLRTLGGALIGLGFIVLVRRVLQRDEHPAVFTGMSGMDARKALLIVGVMTVHSFTEGVGVGVSFGGGVGLGLFITLTMVPLYKPTRVEVFRPASRERCPAVQTRQGLVTQTQCNPFQ